MEEDRPSAADEHGLGNISLDDQAGDERALPAGPWLRADTLTRRAAGAAPVSAS